MLDPSPVPPDVLVDRSGGLRAEVTNHAVRRYCERALRLGEDRLDGLTEDVLPQIRRTGSYAPAAPAGVSGMLEALKDPNTVLALIAHHAQQALTARAEAEEAKMEAAVAKEEVLIAAPKIEAYETRLDDRGCCSLATAARIIGAQQTSFFAWLRTAYVFDEGENILPFAEYRKAGHFRVRLVRTRPGQHREQTLVTRQGLVWLGHRWQAKLARDAREAERAKIQGDLDL